MIGKITFRFYKFDVKLDKTLFHDNPYDFLLEMLKNTTKPNNVYDLNGYKSYCKHIKDNIFCFEKHRNVNLPTIGKITEDKERKIILEKDETVLEKNYFLIDKDLGYIIYQEKKEGFRAQTLIGYLYKLLDIKSGIGIYQILKTDTYQKLLSLGYLKGIDISFAAPSDKLLKKWGISINQRAMFGTKQQINLAIKITLNKKIGVVQYIKEIYNNLKNGTDGITKLSIRGSEDYESNLTELNLLNDVLETQRDVKLKDGIYIEDDIIKELVSVKEIFSDEIAELLSNE